MSISKGLYYPIISLYKDPKKSPTNLLLEPSNQQGGPYVFFSKGPMFFKPTRWANKVGPMFQKHQLGFPNLLGGFHHVKFMKKGPKRLVVWGMSGMKYYPVIWELFHEPL